MRCPLGADPGEEIADAPVLSEIRATRSFFDPPVKQQMVIGFLRAESWQIWQICRFSRGNFRFFFSDFL